MIYAMSDIHGDLVKFNKMLKLINFTDDDHLYVLGDIVDRGDFPITLLIKCLKMDNVTVLMGNHEKMMLNYLDNPRGDNWMYNGGQNTYNQFMEMQSENRNYLETQIKKLEYCKTLRLNDKLFYLVHAGLEFDSNGDIFETQDEDSMIWTRREFYADTYVNDKQTVIFGHTPTKHLHGKSMIWTDTNKICIDCGAVYGGQLGCLRLNDMKEFYIK